MNETEERLLLSIANRMPDSQHAERILVQLGEIQKSLNTLVFSIGILSVIAAAIWGNIYFR